MELFSLYNKIAIVTGALGLLGKQHCSALAEAGAKIIVCDLNEEGCVKFAKSLPTDSLGIFLDVTEQESVRNVRDKILESYGHIDVLVNNAAINDMFENPAAALEQSKFENYPLGLWQKSFDVNVTGVFLCSQVFGKIMMEQKSGSIINIASIEAVHPSSTGMSAYDASKGGVLILTKSNQPTLLQHMELWHRISHYIKILMVSRYFLNLRHILQQKEQ